MHFGKTYAQLLASLPPELRENAIQYRQLKKVIKGIVSELSSLGLTPHVLHRLLEETDSATLNAEDSTELSLESFKFSSIPKVVYELNDGKSQLRMWIDNPHAIFAKSANFQSLVDPKLEGDVVNENSLLWSLQQRTSSTGEGHGCEQDLSKLAPVRQSTGTGQGMIQEVVVPLVQETKFYDLLTKALESVSSHLTAIQSDFLSSLENLSVAICDSVRPASAAPKFHPYSPLTANAGSVRVKISRLKSDLYSWREIFQLYLEAEVFESVGERTRGERGVEESEKRLRLFLQRLTQRGLDDKRKFKMKQSAKALATFLSLNLFILDVKKFSVGNAEATRKILKKHAKRTALPRLLSSSTMTISDVSQALLSYATTFSLSRALVQATGEILIPIIPQIDDYSCLICTSIAFKPIRLSCGHLFCVRCLVKMQKRNKNLCPMCRAPCVLAANRDNVDWGMLNFMQDWFSLEAEEKQLSNEKEAAAEEMEELGINPDWTCLLM